MKERKKIGFDELKKEFDNTTVLKIYRVAKLSIFMWSLISSFLLINIITLFKYSPYKVIILIITGICFFLLIHVLTKSLIRYYVKNYKKHKKIIKKEKLGWKGCRYALFSDNIKNYTYNKKEVIKKINKEISRKKFNLFKNPAFPIFLTSTITFLAIFVDKYYESTEDFSIFYYIGLLHIFALISYYFIIRYFKTVEMKLNEFKEFIERED